VGGSGDGDQEVLTRTADNLYRTGQLDDAIATYDKAAVAAQDTQQVFVLRYKAALIEHGRQNHQAAADRLRRLSLEMPEHARSADVHLLAAWNAAQRVQSDPHALPHYQRLLVEHVENWPAGATTDTARFWLGRLQESQGELGAAAATYQAISVDAPQYEPAIRAAARCLREQLDRLRKTPGAEERTADLARSAARFFEQQIRGPLQDASQTWTPLDRFCAEQAARFWLQADPAHASEAEAVLTAALAGKPAPDASWKTVAQSLLVVALVGQPGKREQAEQILRDSGDTGPEPLLEVLSAVAALSRSAGAASGRELAALQLAVTDRLAEHRTELDGSTRRLLDTLRAEALLHGGRRDEARDAYRQLAEDYPDDGSIQEAYGDLLLSAGDSGSVQEALQQWRRVAARSRPHEARWYRAKYAVVSALIHLKQHQEAAERIRYLLQVPPGVQDPVWEAKFETLLQRCE
jgi:TolA-binding protein